MGNELIINYPTGVNLYALLFDATGQIWNGSAFTAPGAANWTDYDIAMTEVATATGIYRASMPAAAAGVYSFVVRKQAGASPAVADIVVGSGTIQWDGTAEVDLAAILEDTSTTLPALLAGGGSTAYTNTVTDTDSNPLDGVEVWITSDSGGASTVASTTTDTLGTFTVYLDPGTYYLWLAKGGYNFGNPTTITVS
jgi:hypothetical protein